MLKVLVLDDDIDNCQTLEHIVRFAGHDVRSACTGDTFLQLVAQWQPQVVIVDLLLGDTDGVTVLTCLDYLPVKPTVIIVSGANPRLLEAASRSATGHGFTVLGVLSKPFNPKALRQLLVKHQQPQQPKLNNITRLNHDLTLADLTQAFEQNAFYVVYQPKIECRTAGLIGFEALCRLRLPELGEIGPDQFIPLCEKFGLITKLTQYVINSSIPWFADFLQHYSLTTQQTNAGNIRLAINISALSLEQPDVFNYLIKQCDSHQVPAKAIILELTESAAMADPVKSLDILTRLRLQGFQLSIDDFGTGFSSILQLVRLPFSELKIDKHFVGTAASNEESRLVISSLIDMAHALGLTVTAEGIEDRQTLSFLQKKHCDTAQGFYIARPMPASQIADWVAKHQDDKELARIKALKALDILDTAPEERFDRIIRLAQRILNVPICLLSLMDQHRIWYKSKIGMPLEEIERKGSLCELAIQHNGCYYVADTLLNNDTNTNAMVSGPPYIRFYAGQAVAAPNNITVGSLCFIDFKPKLLSVAEQAALRELAAMVEEEFNINIRQNVDPLTKLKNRSGFDKRAQALLKLSRSQNLALQIINIKLLFDVTEQDDSFNVLHDKAIRETAQLIKKSFTGADLIARIDEDSFIVLYLAQNHPLIQLAVESFDNLFNNFKTSKFHNIQLGYSISQPDCSTVQIHSLQQLYMQLDIEANTPGEFSYTN